MAGIKLVGLPSQKGRDPTRDSLRKGGFPGGKGELLIVPGVRGLIGYGRH